MRIGWPLAGHREAINIGKQILYWKLQKKCGLIIAFSIAVVIYAIFDIAIVVVYSER
jgi:hypothetical protein